jgi:hypothetical protein
MSAYQAPPISLASASAAAAGVARCQRREQCPAGTPRPERGIVTRGYRRD